MSFDGLKTTFQNPELVKLSQCTKKMTIIFLRVINISEKKTQKASILREEIRDFKLLRHFKVQTPEH